MTKIQFWKQFTTPLPIVIPLHSLYSVWQRYNFESNLQRILPIYNRTASCIQYDKDTILKAIYNSKEVVFTELFAVFSMTKIQFWKQFTTPVLSSKPIYCCIQYDKDTILKAIYNVAPYASNLTDAVFSMTKIQFWKQFTILQFPDRPLYSCVPSNSAWIKKFLNTLKVITLLVNDLVKILIIILCFVFIIFPHNLSLFKNFLSLFKALNEYFSLFFVFSFDFLLFLVLFIEALWYF